MCSSSGKLQGSRQHRGPLVLCGKCSLQQLPGQKILCQVFRMESLVFISLTCCVPGSQTTPGPMRPVPPPCLWLLVPLPHLLPSLPLWVPLMVRASLPMVTPPLDPSHLALDPADMDLDLDLVMAVLAVCMDPTWEHCSLMVSGVEIRNIQCLMILRFIQFLLSNFQNLFHQ